MNAFLRALPPAAHRPALRACAVVAALLMVGCVAGATPSLTAPPVSEATTPASATVSGAQPLEAGLLDPGVRYLASTVGFSFMPDAQGWLATLPAGGDVILSRQSVTVYILRPETVLQPDGTQAAAPNDAQALADAIDSVGIVTLTSSEPFTAEGVEGLQVDVEAQGGSEANPLLTTASGSLGLPDGPVRLIVLSGPGGPTVISIERAEDPNIAETWEIARPLLATLRTTE